MTRNRNLGFDIDGRRQRQRGPDGKFLPREADGVFGELLKPCRALLKNLMNHRDGWVFNEPVDASKWEIPDYHRIISTPMNLGTVQAKLKGNVYSHPLEFAADVRLTFDNAMTYNPPGHDVYNMASALSKIFESKWKAIQEKIDGTQFNASVEIHDDGGPLRVCDKPEGSEENPVSASEALMDAKVGLDACKPPVTGEMVKNLINTFEEWTDDVPEEIVDFVKRHNTSTVQNGDEIELDFNVLDNEILCELHRLATIWLRRKDQGHATGLLKGETHGVDLAVPSNRSRICRGCPERMQNGYFCDDPSDQAGHASDISPAKSHHINGSRRKQNSASSDYESSFNDSESGRTSSIGFDENNARSSNAVL